MAWRSRGQRLARTAASLERGRRLCVGERRFIGSPAATSALPSTSLPLSPAVRFLVDTNSLDPSLIPPSGPQSRLLKGDVLWYMESGMERERKVSAEVARKPVVPSPSASVEKQPQRLISNTEAQFTDVAVDDRHRTQAISTVQSKMAVPHSSAFIQCQVGPLLSSLRQNSGRDRALLLLESYLVKAAAATLKQIPHSNAVWNGDSLQQFSSTDISLRVPTEGRSLSDPVIIRNADRANIEGILSEVERARNGSSSDTVSPAHPPSLMVCSLVSSSLSHYVDIVQSPYSAVLSIAGVQSVFTAEDGSFYEVVTISLSADARVLNSDLSSQWLHQFKTNVEQYV